MPSLIHLFKKLKGFHNFDYQHKFLNKDTRNNIDYGELNLKQRENMYDIKMGTKIYLIAGTFKQPLKLLILITQIMELKKGIHFVIKG